MQARVRPTFVKVYTLGQFRVLVGDRVVEDQHWRRRSARQLFKLLLSRTGRRATRDEIIDSFWPDSDPEAASSNLRSTLYALRRVLQSADVPVVFTDRVSVWLASIADLWTDADAFEAAVAEAFRSTDPLPALDAASALYMGGYLPDDVYDDWSGERRETLKRTWTDLQFGLAEVAERTSNIDAAVRALERLLRADACDERAARSLMQLLARRGRRPEALRVYQRLVDSLHSELDVEPSPESVELLHQISSTDISAVSVSSVQPFRCSYPFPTPDRLINRQSELTRLMEVVQEGRTVGRVALVTAPAGTGKSALLGEVVRRAQAEDTLCLAGGCYEERGALPFGPFHDALVDYFVSQPTESLRRQLGSNSEDLAQLIPELRYRLQVPSLPTSSPIDRMRAFGAIHACLRSLAERGPVLVCLEDLHAADDATLQLLHYVARQTQRLPLVLIGTYRSDEVRVDQPLARSIEALIRERLAQRITLDSLTAEDAGRLVAARLNGEPSSALSESLYATTGGNPLFLEQLLLALEENGQLERRAGVWHGSAELQGTPQIVRDVIDRRLQQLNPVGREVLSVAAVLGQSFEHRILLAAVEPLHETTLLREVDDAIMTQILVDTPGGYAFRHSVVRDAVYWGLTRPRRALLHARAAELLERFHGPATDEHASELAYHFMQAGASAGTPRKALYYSVAAGRRAAALSSYPEALAHYSRAWELLQGTEVTDDLDLRREVLGGRGWAELELAKWPECVATYQLARTLSDNPIERARASNLIAFAEHHTGQIAGAFSECEAGLNELEGLVSADATEVRLRIQQQIALVWYLQGRYRDIVQLGRGMIDGATTLGRPRAMSGAHLVAAWGHMGLGEVEAAIDHFEKSTSAAEQFGERVYIATSYENLGYELYLGGRFSDARTALERSLALYQDSASELRAVNALQHLCRVWVAEGELDRASEQVSIAVDLATGGRERWVADGLQILGEIQLLRAEWASARSSIARALQIRRMVGDMAGIIESLAGIGLVDCRVGQFQQGLSALQEAITVASAIDPSPPVVLAHRSLGQFYMLLGQWPAAEAEVGLAFRMAQSMRESLEYAPAALASSVLWTCRGEPARAREFAEIALTVAKPVAVVCETHSVLARIQVLLGDGMGAQRHALQAILYAEQLQSPVLVYRAYLAAAGAGLRPEKHTQAAVDAATAAGLSTELQALQRMFGVA
jgi:DNA-binding SARP family transcriptional activator